LALETGANAIRKKLLERMLEILIFPALIEPQFRGHFGAYKDRPKSENRNSGLD
jgi:hypothetical protein